MVGSLPEPRGENIKWHQGEPRRSRRQGAASPPSSFSRFISYGLIPMHRKLRISVFVFPLSNNSIQGKTILGGKEGDYLRCGQTLNQNF